MYGISFIVYNYHTCAIITHGLYILSPLFECQNIFNFVTFFRNYNPVLAQMCMLCVALLEIAHQSPQDFYSMTLGCAAYISPTILTIILSSQVFSIDMAAQLRIGWMLSSVARQTLCNRMHSYSYVSFWSFLFHTNCLFGVEKSKI